MRKRLLIFVAAAVALAGCGSSAHRPTIAQETVILQEVPGNIVRPEISRVEVSGGTLLVQQSRRGGAWRTARTIKLSAELNQRIHNDVLPINRSELAVGAVCHRLPVGDVGGLLLTIDGRSSNCPPATAAPLVSLLSGYLHSAG